MDMLGISILYAVAAALLLADFFLPSHGVLTLASLGLFGYALYLTFQIGQRPGFIALAVVLVVVPMMLYIAVRTWHNTPVGRRISPPNPVLTEKDRLPLEAIEALIGRTGRTLTPLRPVGTAVFGDHRVECSADYGMIPASALVEGVRVADRTLVVHRVGDDSASQGTTA